MASATPTASLIRASTPPLLWTRIKATLRTGVAEQHTAFELCIGAILCDASWGASCPTPFAMPPAGTCSSAADNNNNRASRNNRSRDTHTRSLRFLLNVLHLLRATRTGVASALHWRAAAAALCVAVRCDTFAAFRSLLQDVDAARAAAEADVWVVVETLAEILVAMAPENEFVPAVELPDAGAGFGDYAFEMWEGGDGEGRRRLARVLERIEGMGDGSGQQEDGGLGERGPLVAAFGFGEFGQLEGEGGEGGDEVVRGRLLVGLEFVDFEQEDEEVRARVLRMLERIEEMEARDA